MEQVSRSQNVADNNVVDNDVVDSMEEREVLWRFLILRQDCGNCPHRGSSSHFRITDCLRCYEEYGIRLV